MINSMQTFNFPSKYKKIVLALGAESAGNFSIYINYSHPSSPLKEELYYSSPLLKGGARGGLIYFSQDFGDLLVEKNFIKFKKSVLTFLKKEKIKPDVIITDLHPLMKTTLWGKELAKKFSAKGGSAFDGKTKHISVQHHNAHIFSAIGESLLPLPLLDRETERGLLNKTSKIFTDQLPTTIYGIAMDGTGYGEDENIWGGEVFELKIKNEKLKIIERIGSLENQTMIGGELAIEEPARMLISILNKISASSPARRGCLTLQTGERANKKQKKEFIYSFVKKYYSKNEFELLYNQLEQNFNCVETSSAGRVLDAVSLLLGFCGNERKYKHEAIALLEKNSTTPYSDLKPKIIEIKNDNQSLENSTLEIDSKLILDTTYLFKYLLSALGGSASGGKYSDKKRLAATAQLYLAQGLWEISQKSKVKSQKFAGGGITNNKTISDYFASKNIYLSRNISRGDASLSFGQVFWFLSQF